MKQAKNKGLDDYIYIRLDKKTKKELKKKAKESGSNMTIYVRQLVLRDMLTESPDGLPS